MIRRGERPLHALRERGVEYVEVRCMDLDPFVPVGITAPTMRFLDVFLLHCLLTRQPARHAATRSPRWRATSTAPRRAAASRACGSSAVGGSVTLAEWGAELLEGCAPIAARAGCARSAAATYRDALTAAQKSWHTPQQLPSARVLQQIGQADGCAYTAFVHDRALQTQQQLLALPWRRDQQARFEREAQESLAEQAAIEQADTMPFEAFRQDYVAPDRLMPALATAA